MTDNEMRIAIAEACGWQHINRGGRTGLWGTSPSGSVAIELPNYPNDLNAMHEVEKRLTPEQCSKYQDMLISACNVKSKIFPANREYPLDGFIIHATAHQRAEAFLRTIGKWKG